MLVILEGPDNVGKTTLCQYLVGKGANLIKTPRKVGSHEHDQAFELTLYSYRQKPEVYLLDRHTPSDIAYGLARKEQVTNKLIQWLNFRKAFGPSLLVVWLTRTFPTEQAISDKQIQLTLEQTQTVFNAYQFLANIDQSVPCNVIENGYTGPAFDQIFSRLNSYRNNDKID